MSLESVVWMTYNSIPCRILHSKSFISSIDSRAFVLLSSACWLEVWYDWNNTFFMSTLQCAIIDFGNFIMWSILWMWLIQWRQSILLSNEEKKNRCSKFLIEIVFLQFDQQLLPSMTLILCRKRCIFYNLRGGSKQQKREDFSRSVRGWFEWKWKWIDYITINRWIWISLCFSPYSFRRLPKGRSQWKMIWNFFVTQHIDCHNCAG